MKKFKTIRRVLFGIVVVCLGNSSISEAQLRSQSTSTNGNDPALDSLERANLQKGINFEYAEVSEKPSRKKVKSSVDIRLFQHLSSFKFQMYVSNKTQQKIIIRLWDKNGILVFEDVPQKKMRFQRAYDFSYLPNTDTGEYYFSAFFDNQNHYFNSTRLETVESIEELAKYSTEFSDTKVDN
jgi:hypothetical protein